MLVIDCPPVMDTTLRGSILTMREAAALGRLIMKRFNSGQQTSDTELT